MDGAGVLPFTAPFPCRIVRTTERHIERARERARERESKRERARERERAQERERARKRERQSTQRVIKAWIAGELGQTPLPVGTGARHPVVYPNQRALDWRQRLECTHTWITCGYESRR